MSDPMSERLAMRIIINHTLKTMPKETLLQLQEVLGNPSPFEDDSQKFLRESVERILKRK